jgi:BMFP domain-containing protein YqiC
MIMGAGYTCIIDPAAKAAKQETDMAERPRFFDDLAGVAGGALSAFAGIGQEIEAMVRARIDETIRRLELVRREELDAVAELASNARAGQEAAEAKISALEARVAALEAAAAGAAAVVPMVEGGAA